MGMAVRDAGGAGPCRDSRTRDSFGRAKDGSHIHTARKTHQPLTQTEEKGLATAQEQVAGTRKSTRSPLCFPQQPNNRWLAESRASSDTHANS
ncbi:hypothetical protein F7725_028896 [Dissostichus mawsoni]|uniref:Uncharacterized protein n=1 Tax=Dissostichus mawsoni TaxID=36200 RepID=A0A7J5XJH6_DISMA|nr:hypothetical protein F7725_028896 [Dissostichus mawsoni]